MNLCPESYDAKSQVLTLSLMPGLASMRSPSRQKSLEKKLEAFCGYSVRLEIAEDGKVSGETPAMVQVRREQEEKDQAFRTLMDDPAVQGLVSAFDATAVPESVTPGKPTEEKRMKGPLGNIMKQAQERQEKLKTAQESLASVEVTGLPVAGWLRS